MEIRKADIIAALRARGQDERADWVDRTLPDLVDSARNDSLLKMLELDLKTLGSVDEPKKG